jgi:asparagine synthase (glutamine-hydrolysing)
MCGVAGILGLTPAGQPTPAEVAAMTEMLVHRGPDANAVHVDGDIGLGHTRLAIIDLTGGKQPMHSEDGALSVVFNGEIFNHVELREALQARGHRFRTRSDTEVILHAYQVYGTEMFHRFNGQWAIALWDAPRRRLLLARDRVGVRPLFYARTRERFAFASEVKALARLAGVRLALDPRALGQVLHFWTTLAPTTPFQGIESLPPGHLAIVENGDVSVRRYWDWSFPSALGAFPDPPVADLAEEVRAVLIDAVRVRLRSDVPVGAYLSGGLDSSIVTAMIKRFTDTPLRTFSVTFEDPEFDESRYQQAMVEHLGTHHSSVRCTPGEVARAFPRTIWHTETPIVRTGPTPLLLLSESVRAHGYKVVLTGEGADEVFGGYDLFKEAIVRRFWARQPASRLRPALLARLYPYLAQSPTATQAYAESFFGQGLEAGDDPMFAHAPRWSATQRAWRFFSPEVRAAVADWDPKADLRARLPAELSGWDPLCRDQYLECHTLLSGYLLSSQGDRMAMANSVEGRYPFLDFRVIELASTLPVLMKVMGLKEKFILRKATADLLPEVIARRPKQPYRAPDSRSFFHDGQPAPYVAELMSAERLRATNLFDAGAVGKLFEKCRSGRATGAADNMAFVGVLSTMLVDEMFVRGTAWSDIEPRVEAAPAA